MLFNLFKRTCNIIMADSKTNTLEGKNQFLIESELNSKQIYKSDDFKKEFDELLKRINEEEQNDKDQMYNSSIDLDFLKNDYLELYDLRKLLNDPKYYLAKFKIRFFDFINLNNYFYKVLDKEAQKKIVKNKDIYNINNTNNDINNSNNNSPPISTKKNKKKKKNRKRQKEFKIMKSFTFTRNQKNLKQDNNSNTNKRFKSEPKNNDFSKLYESHEYNNGSRLIEIQKENESSNNVLNNLSQEKNLTISGISQSKLTTSVNSKNDSLFQIAVRDINAYSHKEKIYQFKFNYIKKELGLEEYEKMSGTSYEEFARKSLKIMMMILTQNDIKFENPKKILLNNFFDSYRKNSIKPELKIKTDIHNFILADLLDDKMEIDIVAEFKFEELKELINSFEKNVLLQDGINENNDEIVNINQITLIAEIARNIIIQGKEKLPQVMRYIEFISILNLYKDNLTKTRKDKNFINICKSSKVSSNTEKIFCIITDGDYSILKYVIEKIIKVLIGANKTNKEIKDFIKKAINSNENMKKRINEKEIKLIEENIFNNYLMFENLKKNNIKFFVLYIGDMNQIIYQENLVFNYLSNKNLIKKDEFENIIKSIKTKNNLSKIKQLNKNIKSIISSFIKEIDSITNQKLSDIKSLIGIKDFLRTLDLSYFSKIKKEFKFELYFNVLNNDNGISKIIKNFEEINKSYEFIKALHINSIKDNFEFMESYLKDINSFIEPHIIKIYIIIIKNSQINLLKQIFPNYEIEANNCWPYNLRRLVYIKNEENIISLNFEKSNFQNIFNLNFLNINKIIKDEIENLMKDIKYDNIIDENENLNKINLINKLKDEFIKFLNNKDIPFKDIIFNFDYSLNEGQKKKLLFYFEDAFSIVSERTDKSNDNNKAKLLLKNYGGSLKRLDELTENITCRKIYNFAYYELNEYIIETNYNTTKIELNEFISKLK